jgi:Flp pilus assembly protein TadG
MVRAYKKENNEQGQGLVELALVLPILLVLLFGIVEFGRVVGAGIVVSQSARDAARLGTVGATDTEIENRIKTKTAASLYDPSAPDKLTINIYRTEMDGNKDIEINIGYKVQLYMPFIPDIIGNSFIVNGKSVMRME